MAQLANLTTTLAIESSSFVSGIEQSRGAVQRLLRQLDPAAAATVKYKKEMDLLERGLKDGVLTNDLYTQSVERLNQRFGATVSGADRVARSSGSMRAGFQQLGFQLGDISQGFAMGTSAATIFAQQSGQVIQSLQLMSTETSGLMALLGGPWGAVITAALVAATPFVAKIFEGNDALADQVQKLKDNADQQAIAAQANRVFSGTQAGLEARIRETTNALDQQNASLRTNAELQNIRAKQQYAEAQRQLAEARATLKAAQEQQASMRNGLAAADPRIARAAGADPATLRQSVRDAADAVIKAQEDVRNSSIALNRSRVFLAAEQAASSSTLTGKITKDYDDRIRAAQREAVVAAMAGKKIDGTLTARLLALEKEKAAAIEAAQATDQSAQATARSASAHKVHAAAVHSDTRAIKSITDAEKERLSIIDRLQSKYDPAAAAVRDYVAELKEIARVNLDPKTAARYAEGARIAFEKARAGLFSLSSVEGFRSDAEAADKMAAEQQRAQALTEQKLQRQREDNIRDLGHMYFDLFDGGTKRFLENFQRQGLAIISEMLARWTLGGASGSGGGGLLGGLLKGLGGLIGGGGASLSSADLGGFNVGGIDTGMQFSLPGYASGGSFRFGGRDGIDKNILSLNGSPIARVSKGETATIGRAANDSAPIVFDLRGAVMTDDLLRQMNAIATARAATVMGAARAAASKQAGRRLG